MTEQNSTALQDVSSVKTHSDKSPLWKRILISVLLLIIFGAIYLVIYGFTTAMSYWTGQKEDLSQPDQFYLVVLWPIVMGIAVLIPSILVLMDKRAIWIIVSILGGAIASFVFGWGYLVVIEVMERSVKHG